MPKVITRYPTGFLSLLGAQSDGQAPNTLVDSVQSTLDIGPFIAAPRYVIGGGVTTASLAIGFQPTATLNGPNPGEIWLVQAVSVWPSAALGAATTYTYQPCLLSRGQALPLGLPTTCTVGQQFANTIQFALAELVLNPGDTLGVWVGGTAGLASALQVSERIFVATF